MKKQKLKSSNQLLQDQWSSKLGFIIATTGAAVGLGNVWRFPYMAGTHGGSAFTLLYLIFVVLIGLPIMVAEIIIGRRARQNPVDALASLAEKCGHTKKWNLIGWLGALALLLVLSFYSVVAGWSISYLMRSFSNGFYHLSPKQITVIWQNFLSHPWELLFWHSIFMALTIMVIIRGVQQGLEKATKFMMPALYLILFILVIYGAAIGNFNKAFHFLFDFDTTKITTSVFIAAMGHAFFSLALGAGAMLTYGAYVPKYVKIVSAVTLVATLDVLVAILSGLAIFPLVFGFNLAPNSGPGLMFVTLPISFSHMLGGWFIGGLFFLLLLFAAWTSSINLAEPLVIILMRKLNIKRTPAALIIGFFAWFIGIGSMLSFNLWKHIKIFGKFTLFDIATNIPTDILLPLGGLGYAIFAGWIMTKTMTKEEVNSKLYFSWLFLIRFISPAGILIVFISSIFPSIQL